MLSNIFESKPTNDNITIKTTTNEIMVTIEFKVANKIKRSFGHIHIPVNKMQSK
jgi:hypothetical protein